MLLRPSFSILIATLLSVALCAASNSDTSDESNTSLWDMVPDCARNCTENFIKTEYTPEECTYTTNYKCLCRTETPSNLTLGEAALTCVYALCSPSVIKNTKAYHICDSVSGALPETHATLTATTFAATLASTTSSTSTTSTSSTTSASDDGLITSDIGPTSTSTSTASGDRPSVTPFLSSASELGASSTSEPEASPQTISSTSTSSIETPTNSSIPTTGSSDHHGVSTGTVIGVSVVSGVAGCLIIGVLAFFGVTRWKKNNRVDDSESGGDMFEPAEFPPESFSRESSPHPGPGTGPVPWAPNRPPASQEVSQISRPQVFHPTSQYPPRFATGSGIRLVDSPRDENNQRIGFAVTSESDWGGSPRTVDSQHTTAELLPTPTAGLYPKPLKFTHRPSSGATLFEEEEGQTITEKKLPSLPSTREYSRNGSPTVMAGLPASPRALKEGFRASQFRRPPGQKKPTQIQPQYPRQTPVGPRERTLGPPFSESTYRRSIVSNSSSGPNYSSESSDHTSNTFATTPPFSTAQGRNLTGMSPRKVQPPGSIPPVGPSSPTTDIVSRPRVVRGDDIKRIQPGSSPRPPSEVVVPYCPDDFWLERGRGNTHSRSASGELPYPSETTLGAILYPSSPKKRPEDTPRRISPTSRNLTPSRRGDDLILSVD
ncbi:hypothetical protein N7456_009281 [Penicillium angulare]|uniref:Extracellular membrane protein CFEM domain-containing protein n=1 Tax=Penicillium angulare TaxID=116970 RepID=A0A9W9K5E3_9EURO|nr:hypothetical protein N7456_009281 [Penicillium angulare]